MAYGLLCALPHGSSKPVLAKAGIGAEGPRIALQHTRLAKATGGTIRLKLLKIGAPVRTGVRRITFAMASGCPDQRDFARVHTALTNAAAR